MTPKTRHDGLEDIVHNAINRALDEACVRGDVIRGMALEVGLELFAARLAAIRPPADATPEPDAAGVEAAMIVAATDGLGGEYHFEYISHDHVRITPLAAAPQSAAPADAGGEEGMLPDALVPVAKEWYSLCERRFHATKITISGELAEAIVEAVCAKSRTPSPVVDANEALRAVIEAVRYLRVAMAGKPPKNAESFPYADIDRAQVGLAAVGPKAAREARIAATAAIDAIVGQEGDREAAMVVLEVDGNGKPTVWCDPEIADLVYALNSAGIRTIASCSGHGTTHGNIALKDGRELLIAPTFDAAREMDAALRRMTATHEQGEGVTPRR